MSNRISNLCFCGMLIAVALFASCKRSSSSSTVTLGSDATLTSFSFRAHDSFPDLNKITFTIDELADAGLVYNVDSMAYGTRIDSVVPQFRFNTTPGAVYLYTSDYDSISLSGSDTLDLSTSRPVRIRVISGDLSTSRRYNIYINIHQVDPDLFLWHELTHSAYSSPISSGEQRAFWLKDKFVMLTNDGFNTYVHTSVDGVSWTEQTATMPVECSPRRTIEHNGSLYSAAGNSVYISQDGISWLTSDVSALGIEAVNMLMSFADSLWAIVRNTSDDTYHLATSSDGLAWVIQPSALQESFPISEFTATSFVSRSYRNRAIVIGGFDRNGKCLTNCWSVEEISKGSYRWADYSLSQPEAQVLHGAAVVEYNDVLYLFGGMDDNNVFADDMRVSDDEGYSWHVPDSAHNVLPATYEQRTRTSAIAVDNDIYIIGGQTRHYILSDVLSGHLNSIDF